MSVILLRLEKYRAAGRPCRSGFTPDMLEIPVGDKPRPTVRFRHPVLRDLAGRFRWLLLALGSQLLALSSPAAAAEPANLGNSLSYLRVHSLADAVTALRSSLSVNHACVLDLRYTTASEESTGALQTALAQHPAEAPLFILISPATPPGVVDAINQAQPRGAIVTLGFTSSRSAALPKIAVKTDAETDRRAYDALEAGTPVETLISGKIEKERFDEATLVQEFKNGNPDAAPPTPPDPTAPKPADAPVKPLPLIDRVLQRAVQLHQALLALRR